MASTKFVQRVELKWKFLGRQSDSRVKGHAQLSLGPVYMEGVGVAPANRQLPG